MEKMKLPNRIYIKRRYFDMRTGGSTVQPALQLTNFIMLSYLTINDIIPIWLFAPLFIIGIVSLYTLVGNKFRKLQSATDLNMHYEKGTEQAKTLSIFGKRINEIANELSLPDDPKFNQRIDYLDKIGDSKL